jgi:hypothetical protein
MQSEANRSQAGPLADNKMQLEARPAAVCSLPSTHYNHIICVACLGFPLASISQHSFHTSDRTDSFPLIRRLN